jgi:thymidylate synthase (FAD)
MDSHAQKEIRDYATIIGEEIVAKWVPATWAAFNDYHTLRGAMDLTCREIAVLSVLNRGVPFGVSQAIAEAEKFGWINRSKKTGKLKRNRERGECEEKLKKLGLSIPWKE